MKTIKIPNLKSTLEIERFVAQKPEEYRALDSLIQGAEKLAITRVFGNAAVFLLYYFNEVVKHFENFTNEEKSGVRAAIHADYGKFPSAYYRKGTPLCSQIIVEFNRGKWNVLSFTRVPVPKNKIEITTLPEKAREKALNLFCNY